MNSSGHAGLGVVFVLASVFFIATPVGCSSSTTTTGSSTDGGGTGDGATSDDAGGSSDDAGGDDGGGAGTNEVTGTFGSEAVKPIVSAFWIGLPGDPAETGGGPFVYLFSSAVTCKDLSSNGWYSSLPAGTQVTELLVGTTTVGKSVSAASHAAANALEANYLVAPSATENRATSGSVTLTSYVKNTAVAGTLDLTFPSGNAKGTFYATWCAAGTEL